MKKKHPKKEKPLYLFGRIVTQLGKFDGRPFLLGHSVELGKILDMLHEDKSDGEISHDLHIPKEDIDLCRAWQVRFEPERLTARFASLANPQKFFMLDENSSERMLYDIARLFGRSSHVRAEGLTGARNDDVAFVWSHVIRNDYKAFLTADTDFRLIARQHRQSMASKYGSIAACPDPVPVVIFYDNQDSPEKVVRLLENNQDAILRLAVEKDVAYATLASSGLVKDNSTEKVAPRARQSP